MRSHHTMNYTVVGLVVILVITVTQYMVVRKQFAAYRAKNLVEETERSNLVNQLKDQVEPLKSQFQTCQSERQKEADVAKKQVDDLTAEKNRIQADLDAKTKEVGDLSGVQQQKDALAQEKTGLEAKVKELEASVAKLTEDVQAAQAKTAEAEKQANEAKQAAEAAAANKPAEEAKKDLLLAQAPLLLNQTQSNPQLESKLVIDPVVKSILQQDQTGGGAPVSLDNPQDKPKMSASPHLKFEDGNGPMDAKSLQNDAADQTKEQIDKADGDDDDLESLDYSKSKAAAAHGGGLIVLDQKEREMAQLPDVDPSAIQVKSIDKIEPKLATLDKEVTTVEKVLYDESKEDSDITVSTTMSAVANYPPDQLLTVGPALHFKD